MRSFGAWSRRGLLRKSDPAVRLRSWVRVAEAAALLTCSKVLILLIPLKYWRQSLGRLGASASEPHTEPAAWPVAAAVTSAAQLLPFNIVCLPRAMATQWMLRRRRIPSALVFGVLPQLGSGDLHALHAWVESGGRIVIGDDPARNYHRALTLVQP
jgi:Transglutaminase-like superfamily